MGLCCGLTRFFGPNTVQLAKDSFLFRELDTVLVKGKSSLCKLYQPLVPCEQADPQLLESLDHHKQALELMYRQEFSGAGTGFAQLEQDCPGDSLYYALMREKAAKGLAVASTEELFDE